MADAGADLEDASWLAFLVYLGPLEGEEPFAEIDRVRTSWASGEMPELDGVRCGPMTAHQPARGTKTLEAYRTWAARAGSQALAYTGETAWPPERRFARAFERLSLPGLHRDARFDLLVTLGRLGVYDLRAGSLALGGVNDVTVGAKRALGIGDPLLLERRARVSQERAGSRSRRSISACTTGSAACARRLAWAPSPSPSSSRSGRCRRRSGCRPR